MNRVIFCLALLATAGAGAQVPAPVPATSGEAAALLGAAREALGGDTRLAAVRTVVATGHTRQLQGDNLVPIEFSITIELPDKYVRTDEIPARESGPSSRGFNGDALIQSGDAPASAGRRAGAPPPERGGGPGRGAAPGPGQVVPLKQDFARLTLGMFAASFSAYPLSFGHAGYAEAPEGKAHVLDVKGAGNFSARLFVDTSTHLPLMLSWTTPPNLVPIVAGHPPPANLPPGAVTFETPAPPPESAGAEEKKRFEQDALAARKKALAGARPTEQRLYYADYRDVGGLKLPFRIRRAVGALTVEETIVDRYRINVRVDARKFEVRP